jgi:hypothetical protein
LDARVVVKVSIASKSGEPLLLTTNSSGKNVDLAGCNLRVILKEITRYMLHLKVKQILLARSFRATQRHEASVGRRTPRQRGADKSTA